MQGAAQNTGDESTAPVASGTPAAQEGMGKRVGRGATLTVVATVLSKGLAAGAQIFLGLWLSKGDFAVYGLALSISGVVQVFRDGGVREVLIQRGPKEYPRLIGPVFWLATAMNIVAALLMCGVALGLMAGQRWGSDLLSESYRDSKIPWMLFVIAVSIPLSTLGAVLQARMRLDLKFGALSALSLVSALARNIAMIGFAWWLRNPLAFVLPLIVVALYEGFASYRAVRETPWKLAPHVAMWRELLATGGWMIVQTLAGVMLDVAPFAMIGIFLEKDPVGVYVFAYTWIAQVGTLLGFALQQVLFSALARLASDAERLRAAVIRAQHVQMLLGATASMGLAVVIGPMERIIWGGKWEAAVATVIILGLFFPFRVTYGLSTALMMAQGRFRELALLTAIEGIGVTGFGTLGAYLHRSPEGVAIWTGASLLVTRIACTWWAMRPIQLGIFPILRGMLPAWVIAAAAAAAALWVESLLAAPGVLDARLAFIASATLRKYAEPGILLCVSGGIFTLLMAIFSRMFLASSLREVAEALPGKLGGGLRVAMRL